MESLQAIIKDKTEDHDSLIAANQQAQRDLTERNEEIDKLAGRIRELEQALLNSAESNRSVSQLEQELNRVKLREQELTQVRTNANVKLNWLKCQFVPLLFPSWIHPSTPSVRINRRWSSSSCPAGFRSQPCSLSWMRQDTVTLTMHVTPPRSSGMPWTLLSRAYRAKSKRSVRSDTNICSWDGLGWLLVAYWCNWL